MITCLSHCRVGWHDVGKEAGWGYSGHLWRLSDPLQTKRQDLRRQCD